MKFKVGEIAICVGMTSGILRECEILDLPRSEIWASPNCYSVEPGHYLIRVPCITNRYGGHDFQCPEAYLRKRPERGIPKEVREIFEIQVNA